jgi:hypothetical protein
MKRTAVVLALVLMSACSVAQSDSAALTSIIAPAPTQTPEPVAMCLDRHKTLVDFRVLQSALKNVKSGLALGLPAKVRHYLVPAASAARTMATDTPPVLAKTREAWGTLVIAIESTSVTGGPDAASKLVELLRLVVRVSNDETQQHPEVTVC